MVTTCLELSMAATPESVGPGRRRVAELAARIGAPTRVVDDVRLCVSEALANAVQHAYGRKPGTVAVTVELDDDEITVVVRDAGRGLAGRRPGRGYGLHIIESLTRRHVISSTPHGGTEVRMTFGLGKARAPAARAASGRVNRPPA